MTLEEIQAQLAALKEAMDVQAGEISSLKTKNAELITEKKKDREKFEARLAELADAKGGKGDDDDKKEPKTAKEIRQRIEAEQAGKLAELTARLDAAQSKADNAAIEAELDDVLAAIPAMQRKAVKALLRSSRKFEVANSEVLCDGQSVRDSVGAWLATDEGKAFTPAPANGGSAAPGGASGIVSKPKSKMTQAEKGAYIRVHGADKYAALPA